MYKYIIKKITWH